MLTWWDVQDVVYTSSLNTIWPFIAQTWNVQIRNLNFNLCFTPDDIKSNGWIKKRNILDKVSGQILDVELQSQGTQSLQSKWLKRGVYLNQSFSFLNWFDMFSPYRFVLWYSAWNNAVLIRKFLQVTVN